MLRLGNIISKTIGKCKRKTYIFFRLMLTFLFMRVKSFTLGQRAHGGERGAVSAGRGAVSAGRGVAGRGDTPLLGTRGGAPRG